MMMCRSWVFLGGSGKASLARKVRFEDKVELKRKE